MTIGVKVAMLGQKPTAPLSVSWSRPAGSAPKSPQLHSMALDRVTADQAVVVLTGGQGVFSVGLESTTERLA